MRIVNAKGLQAAARKVSSQLLVGLLVVGIVAFVGVFIWQSIRIKEMQAEFQEKQTALKAVEERNNRLQEHQDFYNSPGYMLYVEKVAREALGLAKPGETVVLAVPDKGLAGPANPSTKPTTEAANSANAPSGKKPSWQNWFGFFFS